MGIGRELWIAYRLRLKRRRLLFRAIRKRRQLTPVVNRTDQIAPGDILVVSTVRNEMVRLPHFLDYYRKLGVNQFLFVDNDSNDGTGEYLGRQADVSLWSTPHSYKRSRFGVDWLTWLQFRYAHGHWCLALDADEILVYPHMDTRPLRALTDWLDANSVRSFGTIMLDMYPKGPLNEATYKPGQDPIETLNWFDADNYFSTRRSILQNVTVQGGVRVRCFFADEPLRGPTMSKTPLVKWNRRYTYVSSTHSLLPRKLNHVGYGAGDTKTTGVLLHTKFLPMIAEKSREEKQRQEHFANSSAYDDYYDGLIANPDLWCEQSCEYAGWRQLVAKGLMSSGEWR